MTTSLLLGLAASLTEAMMLSLTLGCRTVLHHLCQRARTDDQAEVQAHGGSDTGLRAHASLELV